ncbi:MAG: nodulation protein NfeD [Candidatus Binatia bacterium]
MSRTVLVATVVAAWLMFGAVGAAQDPAPALARIVIDGTINPATADFVHETIGRAQADGAVALVIELDTPGGLLPSMHAIVKDILAARLPVIVYVAPSGAGAGSAGVFITLAAHVAAMAPGTNIGAAHPVGGQGEDITGTLGAKLESFTASFNEAIARQRGRNVEWAIKAVRESASIPAEEAAKINVVDFVARDLVEVVRRAEGRPVDVGGARQVLALARVIDGDHVRVHEYHMRIGQRVLDLLADPNIAYVLMMAGLLGLYVEFTHPGLVFPGVVGGICLLLGLTATHVLPLNASGLALIALGVALLVAEAFLPAFGLVGAGGVVAFLLGSLFLFDTAGTGVAVAPSLVFGVGGTIAGFMLVVGTLVVRSQRRRPASGSEALIGSRGVARDALAPSGMAMVHGEYWRAESIEPVAPGEAIEVIGVEGLTLRVRPVRAGSR